MLNQMVLVGKVKELRTNQNSSNKFANATLILEVERNIIALKNEVNYDTFAIILWQGIGAECLGFCKQGNIVGVRGRLRSGTSVDESSIVEIVCEKISFLNDSVED